MRDQDIIRILKIEADLFEAWVNQGWIARSGDEGHYSDADLARARLILDLSVSLGVNEAGIDVAIGLIDQLHGTRVVMRHVIERVGRHDPKIIEVLFRDVIDID